MLQFAMPVTCHALVPEVLPAAMPAVSAVPEFLPAAPAAPALPSSVPADLPGGREALAEALAGPVPGAQRKNPGKQVLSDDSTPLAWDDTPEGAAEWAASAPARILHRLGAPRDAAARPRRPDVLPVLGDPPRAAD